MALYKLVQKVNEEYLDVRDGASGLNIVTHDKECISAKNVFQNASNAGLQNVEWKEVE